MNGKIQGEFGDAPLTVMHWLEVQQSTSASKPREAGQLFDPQARLAWHSSWVSQSPSFSEQVLQLQNPISPLLAVAQLTKQRVLELNFYF